MVSARTEYARHLVVLGALALGVLALLLVPALASAQTAAPAASVASPSLLEESPFATEATPTDPAATDPAPPPAAEPAPAEPAQPAPPPAATEPEPTPAPAPPSTEPQPTTPVTATPTPAETPAAEATPETHQTVVLPPAPSLPISQRTAVGSERLDATTPALPPDAPVITPVAPPTAPPDAPTGAATANAASDALAKTVKELTPRSNLEALGGVSRAPDALTASREIGPGPAGQSAAREDGVNPFDTLTAIGGPAPAGSSLFSVLASYVMPGGGLPATSIILFVQLAVILAAFYAPRAGIGERIHALGRLGPRHGYRTVLARPG